MVALKFNSAWCAPGSLAAWRRGCTFLFFTSNILLLCGGLYGELYERAYIIRYLPHLGVAQAVGEQTGAAAPAAGLA